MSDSGGGLALANLGAKISIQTIQNYYEGTLKCIKMQHNGPCFVLAKEGQFSYIIKWFQFHPKL